MQEYEQSHKLPVWHLAVLATVGGLITWLIMTRSLPAALVEISPETALVLQPAEPRALANMAEAKLNDLLKREAEAHAADKGEDLDQGEDIGMLDRISALSKLAREATGRVVGRESNDVANQGDALAPRQIEQPEDLAEHLVEIQRLAEKIVAIDPTNSRALRIIGQLAEQAGDIGKASQLLPAAARRSIRESYAVYWQMQKSRQDKDHAAVLRHADTLLRTRSQAVPVVVPVLTEIAEDKSASSELKALLKTNPPWRSTFFERSLASITDARTPLELLLSMNETPFPPTAVELRGYMNFLIQRQFHELAYYTWLQFLPSGRLATATPLYNSSFEFEPSGLPFDWVIASGSGVTAQILARQDNPQENALFVGFGQGRAEFPGVRQVVLLGPGTYALTGKYNGTIVGRRGLIWRVSCTDKKLLAESDMLSGGSLTEWRHFALSFEVPATGCRAQDVRLELDARSASEKLVSGAMWFDEMGIRRAP